MHIAHGCIPQSELGLDDSYTCASCRKEQEEEGDCADMGLLDDAAVAESFAGETDCTLLVQLMQPYPATI